MPENRRQNLLVLRAQCGDRAAFDELLAGVQVRLHRYLAGLVGDRHLAEDVLQEAFVIVWKKLGWLRDPALFRPWLHRIATREAFRRLRRARAASEVELDELDVAEARVESELEASSDALERLPELVASISPASRAVLLLHYWEGLRLEDVAEVLDISLGTVKSRLNYGLVALRRSAGSIDGRAASEPGTPAVDRASTSNTTHDRRAHDARGSEP